MNLKLSLITMLSVKKAVTWSKSRKHLLDMTLNNKITKKTTNIKQDHTNKQKQFNSQESTKTQLHYYVHVWTNTLGRGMNSLPLAQSAGAVEYTDCTSVKE